MELSISKPSGSSASLEPISQNTNVTDNRTDRQTDTISKSTLKSLTLADTNFYDILYNSPEGDTAAVLSDTAFISRVSILTRDIDIAILSVCLSVRYVPVFYENR